MLDFFQSLEKILTLNSPAYLQGGCVVETPWIVGKPANVKQIRSFEEKGYVIPDALKKLLLLANGIRFVSNEQALYSIETIEELAAVSTGTLKPGIYEFGYFMEDQLYIDSSRVQSGNYIFYAGESFNEGILLGYGMETFLDYIFASNFNNYWRWIQREPEVLEYLVF